MNQELSEIIMEINDLRNLDFLTLHSTVSTGHFAFSPKSHFKEQAPERHTIG
jgi:hypothetical protein